MTNEDVIKKICNTYQYRYNMLKDGRIVMDTGLGILHKPTTKWVGIQTCGHREYNSVYELFVDWLDMLKHEAEKHIIAEEIRYIEELV